MNWLSGKRFLITGCGGDIGQSICKILKEYGCFVAGCDVHDKHPGLLLYDEATIVPRVDADGYREAIEELLDAHDIDILIPMSEPELRYFNETRITKIGDTKVLIANKRAMDTGFDKLATAKMLQEAGENAPWTIPVSKGEPKDLPCILKSRRGCGSKTVVRVEEGLVDYYSKTRSESIWQELLLPEDQEYTCGVFSDGKRVRSIIFRRDLRGGLTGYAEVVEHAETTKLLESIARFLDLRGSINVQLRITDRGPVIFEINPRFSSTVLFRHILGFTDLVWSLELLLGREVSPYTQPLTGTKIYKGSRLYIREP